MPPKRKPKRSGKPKAPKATDDAVVVIAAPDDTPADITAAVATIGADDNKSVQVLDVTSADFQTEVTKIRKRAGKRKATEDNDDKPSDFCGHCKCSFADDAKRWPCDSCSFSEFCSERCVDDHYAAKHERTCAECSGSFDETHGIHYPNMCFCSTRCRDAYDKYHWIPNSCGQCKGNLVTGNLPSDNFPNVRFCSIKCVKQYVEEHSSTKRKPKRKRAKSELSKTAATAPAVAEEDADKENAVEVKNLAEFDEEETIRARSIKLFKKHADNMIVERCTKREYVGHNRVADLSCGACNKIFSGSVYESKVSCSYCYLRWYCDDSCRRTERRHWTHCYGRKFALLKKITDRLAGAKPEQPKEVYAMDDPDRYGEMAAIAGLMMKTRDMAANGEDANNRDRTCANCKESYWIADAFNCTECLEPLYCSRACRTNDHLMHVYKCTGGPDAGRETVTTTKGDLRLFSALPSGVPAAAAPPESDGPSHNCGTCGKTFTTSYWFNCPALGCTANRTYCSWTCRGKHLVTHSSLSNNNPSPRPSLPSRSNRACDECGKTVANPWFTCSICNYATKHCDSTCLNKHMAAKHQEKPSVAAACFTAGSGGPTVSAEALPPDNCGTCGSGYRSSGRFYCDACNYSKPYCSIECLEKHVATHLAKPCAAAADESIQSGKPAFAEAKSESSSSTSDDKCVQCEKSSPVLMWHTCRKCRSHKKYCSAGCVKDHANTHKEKPSAAAAADESLQSSVPASAEVRFACNMCGNEYRHGRHIKCHICTDCKEYCSHYCRDKHMVTHSTRGSGGPVSQFQVSPSESSPSTSNDGCVQCGKSLLLFTFRIGSKKYCSAACYQKDSEKPEHWRRSASVSSASASSSEILTVACGICGKMAPEKYWFTCPVLGCSNHRYNSHYCSMTCQSKHLDTHPTTRQHNVPGLGSTPISFASNGRCAECGKDSNPLWTCSKCGNNNKYFCSAPCYVKHYNHTH